VAGLTGLLVLAFAGLVEPARASSPSLVPNAPANWPRWRGPNENGSIDGGSYPVKWSPTNGIAWTAPLPGKGCSTPAVWGGMIYLTAASGGHDAVLAFDAAGKRLWVKELGAENPGKNKNGSGANPSPTTDGEGLFAHFKSGELAALELDGRTRWTTNLSENFGKDTLFWDFGSTPTLTEKDVVVTLLRNGQSWIAAFDKHTGALDWRVARDYATPLEGDHSYASPMTIRQEGKEALLVWGATHLTAHDPADGRTLWDCGDFNPDGRSYWPAVSSPVVVPYGRGEVLHGIRLNGAGDVTATHRVWKQKDIGAFVPTPAEQGGRVYVLRDGGDVVCVSPTDGKVLWQGALPKNANKYYASPLVAGGNLYAAREDGVVFVIRAEGPFAVLAQNNLEDRLIASPVPFGARLLFRGEKQLYCVGGG
jgi:outer membrane protein assembly factor BamB